MIKQQPTVGTRQPPSVPVSDGEVRRRASLDRISWDNMRLLLILSEAGSFRSAATVAGISLNTIRSKIERLERQIGGLLIRRSVEGVTLTQEGYELVSIARQMRALGQTAERVQVKALQQRDAQPRVRMTITEGLGTFWLVPD
jgi:DNA-binding transcriptional LysR family regulator